MTQLRKRHLPALILLVAVSIAASVVVAAPPVSASPRPSFISSVSGTVTDPGLAIDHVKPVGSVLRFHASGGSSWFGDLQGTTTYKGRGVFDPATNEVRIFLRETFTGTFDGRTGTLRCVELMTQHADGSGEIDMVIVGGGGDLAGTRGYLQFLFESGAPGQPSSAEYHGELMG